MRERFVTARQEVRNSSAKRFAGQRQPADRIETPPSVLVAGVEVTASV